MHKSVTSVNELDQVLEMYMPPALGPVVSPIFGIVVQAVGIKFFLKKVISENKTNT